MTRRSLLLALAAPKPERRLWLAARYDESRVFFLERTDGGDEGWTPDALPRRSAPQTANVTESDPCAVCSDATRDATSVCVVEQPRDVAAIEEAQAWRGVYHVLGGRVSPLDGVSAEDLTLARLVERVRSEGVREVVIATSPDLEGDGTALYVERALEGLPARVTRIARGVPSGTALEHASSAMLKDAFRGRSDAPRSAD